MVLLTLGAFRYSGVDTDIVSLPLNIEAGAIFDAVDTLRKFVFNGTAWVEFVKGTGEINEMANVGVGTGLIFRDKIGVTFNIKSLIGGTNVLVTDNADDITISTTGSSPLTTKGDLLSFTTVEDRLPVGTNGQILSANSAIAIGVEWIDSVEVFTWSANHNANGFALEAPSFADPTDNTKLFNLSLVNMTTGITLTLLTAQSTSQSLSIPDITQSDTLVTEKFAQLLAQKTLDLPIIADFSNATHDHSDDVNGGSTLKIRRAIQQVVVEFETATTVKDGVGFFHVDQSLNLNDLIDVHAEVITAGTTGVTTVQIFNINGAVDMLSTPLTIDSGQTGSDTASVPAVINPTNDNVALNDVVRIDVDTISGTPAKGLIVTMGFKLP